MSSITQNCRVYNGTDLHFDSHLRLLGGQAVGDQLFPWLLGSRAGSAVGPATDWSGQLPCFLGQRAHVGEDSGPVCSLGGGGGTPTLNGVEEVGCCYRLRSSDIWDIPVFCTLPPGLLGPRVRDAGFPKRTSNASGSGLPWQNVQSL